MQIRQTIQQLAERFTAAGIDNARRVAEELLAHRLDCKPLEIYLTAPLLPPESWQKLEVLVQRIEQGEPMQYVIGHVDFRGHRITCDPRALIPRPETELLVEEVVTVFNNHPTAHIVDVGTGSGCIALAIASESPRVKITALDLSAAALELAQENAEQLGLTERIQWQQNNLLEGFLPTSCTAVVANLPYIDTTTWQTLDTGVRDHEPRMALDCGPTGMELIEKLVAQARSVLIPDGLLFLEYGYDQGAAVEQCLRGNGYTDIQIKRDLAGLHRIAIARNPTC